MGIPKVSNLLESKTILASFLLFSLIGSCEGHGHPILNYFVVIFYFD